MNRDFDGVADIIQEVFRQDNLHGRFGPPTGRNVRLALAVLQDEVDEALDAWRLERLAPTWTHTRDELVQVAAVAHRIVREIDPGQR